MLKDEGLIDRNRGQISILDLPGLRQRSCECYGIIKDHLDIDAAFEDFEDDQTKECLLPLAAQCARRHRQDTRTFVR